MNFRELLATLFLASAATAGAQPSWETTTPEAQGMDSRALQSLVEIGAMHQMDSLLVARNGKLVLETYYAPFRANTRHNVNSVTKGIVAGLTGIAVGQGAVPSVDQPVLQLLPNRVAATDDARKGAMTVQHLLDMTSGLQWREPLGDGPLTSYIDMGRSADWTQFVLDQPMAQAPGAGFNYNSGNSQLLSAILQARTGLNAENFAAQHLFRPLGITDWHWRKDPKSVSTGGFGLYLQPRDMAKIGQLYLQRGEWQGRQVIPRAWVDKVFAANVPMGQPLINYRYGDGWWTLPERQAYMAVGFHGQVIMVLPKHGIVAVTTSRAGYPMEQLVDQIEAAVKSPAPLPANAAAAQALSRRVQAAAVELQDRVGPVSPLAARISGRTWKVPPNDRGGRDFVLRLDEPASLEVLGPRNMVFRLGTDGRFVRSETEWGPALSKAQWIDDRTLSIQTRYLEEGETATYLLRFDGADEVAVDYDYTKGRPVKFTARAAP